MRAFGGFLILLLALTRCGEFNRPLPTAPITPPDASTADLRERRVVSFFPIEGIKVRGIDPIDLRKCACAPGPVR